MCLRFSTSKKLSPRQKLLLAYLGDGYTKNRIDLENVIYRDLGDYEIEISDELKNVNIYKYTDDKDNQLQGAIDVMYGRK